MKKRDKMTLNIIIFIIILLLILFVIKNFSTEEDVEGEDNPVSNLVEKSVEKYKDFTNPQPKIIENTSNSVKNKLEENSAESWKENMNIWKSSWEKIKDSFDKKSK